MSNLRVGVTVAANVTGQQQVNQLNTGLRQLSQTPPLPNPAGNMTPGLSASALAVRELAKEMAALASVTAVASFAKNAIDASQQAEAAFKGLESVANRTGTGIEAAWKAAGEITQQGVLSQTDASAALKNLLQKGFSAEESVKLIKGLTDAAAYGRQSTLGWAEAVVSATEGLRNENSAIVDNAGLTKNVAKIYEEFAKSIGKSAQEMTDADKVRAIMTVGLAELKNQSGDTEKALAGIAGQNARLEKSWSTLKSSLGEQFTPALAVLSDALKALIDGPLTWLNRRLQMVGLNIAYVAQNAKDLWDAVANGENQTQALDEKLAQNKQDYLAGQELIDGGQRSTQNIKNNEQDVLNGKRERLKKEQEDQAKADAETAAKAADSALKSGARISSAKLERLKADNEQELALLDQQRAKRLISDTTYFKRRGVLEQTELVVAAQAADGAVDALRKKRDAKAKADPKDKNALAEMDAEVEAAQAAADAARKGVTTAAIRTQTDIATAGVAAAKDAESRKKEILIAGLDAAATLETAAAEKRQTDLDAQLDGQLLTHRAYLEAVKQEQLKALDFEVNQLQARRVQATRESTTGDAAQRSQAKAELMKLNADLEAAAVRRQTVEVKAAQAIAAAERDLLNARKDLLAQVQDLEGRSLDSQMGQLQRRYEDLRKQFADDAEGLRLADKFLNLAKLKANFEQANKVIGEQLQSLGLTQTGISRDVELGFITESEGAKRSAEARQQIVAALEAQVAAMQRLVQEEIALATAQGRSPNQTLLLQLEQVKRSVQEVKDQSLAAANEMNKAFAQLGANAFKDLITGAKSFEDVLRNLISGVLQQLADVMLKRIMNEMFAGLSGVGGKGSGGVGGAALSLLGGAFADGGHITGAGTGTSDSILIRASNGEYMMRAASVRRFGVNFFNALNAGQLPATFPGFARGGPISDGVAGLKNAGASQTSVTNNIMARLFMDRDEVARDLGGTAEFGRHVIRVVLANKSKLGL